MAIQAYVNLRAEAHGYVGWCQRIMRIIRVSISFGQNMINTCTRQERALQAEMLRLRNYWRGLGLWV
jgi:hypothetical protein